MLFNLKRAVFQELRSIVPIGRCIRTNPFDVASQIRKSFKKEKKQERKEEIYHLRFSVHRMVQQRVSLLYLMNIYEYSS